MDKIRLGMLGSCVTRDSIETQIQKYDVQNYVTFISPYTIMAGDSVKLPEDIFLNQGISNFTIKCLSLDAEKNAIDYLKAANFDWFIFDIIPLQGKIYEYPDKKLVITQPHQAGKCIPILNKYFNAEPLITECWDLPQELIIDRVKALCEELKKFIEPSNIILNETYGAMDFIGKNNLFLKFSSTIQEQFCKINELYKVCYSVCENILSGCHIIKPLGYIIANENHKWGLHPLHYCDAYYQYVEETVSIIINQSNKINRAWENDKLKDLNLLYTEKFYTIRERAQAENIKLESNKWRSYSYTFKQICLYVHDDILSKVFTSKGIHRVAIYGDTEISKVLVKMLSHTETHIVYIVENANKPLQGILTLNRGETAYPDADIMLIADIYNFQSIYNKLSKLDFSFPLVNAGDWLIKSINEYIKENGNSDLFNNANDILLWFKHEFNRLNDRLNDIVDFER